MPPSNVTPATATEILVSALPYITTLDVSELSGQKKVYYKLTNDLTHDAVVTFWFWGTIPGNQTLYYSPDYEGYDSVDLDTNVFDAYPNNPSQVPIKKDASYWIEVWDRWYGTTTHLNQTLNINISLKPYSTTFSTGQIIIFSASTNSYFESRGGLHAGFIDPNSGQIVNFLPFFPSTEGGDVLANGIYLINDNYAVTGEFEGERLLLLNPSFEIVKTIDLPPLTFSFEPLIRTNNATNKFWIAQTGYSGIPSRYVTVSSTGILGSITNFLPFPGPSATIGAHAALNDESYLLVAPNRLMDNNIQKWNLTTLAWDGTIGTVITNYTASDILVMNDDTIIVIYEHRQYGLPEYNKTSIIKRYNLAGTELNSVTITPTMQFSASPRLGYSADPTHFWLWMPLADGRSLLKKIKISDFSFTIDTEIRNVYDTAWGVGEENPTPELIYTSDSCPIIETRVAGSGGGEPEPPDPPVTTDISGIYFLNPLKTHDIYYNRTVVPIPPETGGIDRKIPDPTIRTALIGE